MNGTKQMFLFCFFFLTFLWQYTSFPCLQYLSMLGCSLHLILFSVENFLEFIGYVFIRRLIHFVHKIGVSLAFANKAAIPSHVSENKNSHFLGNWCNRGSHCGSFILCHKWLAREVMISCVQIPDVWEHSHVRTFWRSLYQMIQMTDFDSGISKWPNQLLRCAMKLIYWLVQLSNHIIYLFIYLFFA